MQLDLFGFPLEEKPAKKQEKKAGVEKTQAKQDAAPAQAKTAEPVEEEYTEVNIHAIPGLRQISILDAEAVANPQAAAVTTPGPATILEEMAPVDTVTEEKTNAEAGYFEAEAKAEEEIPVEVLEAMAEETAILEEELEEQEIKAETPDLTPETAIEPVTEEAHMVEAMAVSATGEDTAAEPVTEQQTAGQANQPVEEAVVPEQATPPQEVVAENISPANGTEELPHNEELPINEVTPAILENEPQKIHIEEEPELVIYASGEAGVDDNAIDFNQTLFSKQSVEEMVSPTKKAALTAKGKRGRKSFKDIDAEIALVEVPDDEELFQKLYYPISQVAQWFNVNTSLLRFWENEFDILKPRKNRKGDRLFRPEDVKNLQVIYHLLRQRKFSIEGAKKYIKQNKSRAEVNIQLIQSLTKFRSFLLEMKANLGA